MRYINKKTGAVIEVDSALNGENWEMEKTSPKKITKTDNKEKSERKTTHKTTAKKKTVNKNG